MDNIFKYCKKANERWREKDNYLMWPLNMVSKFLCASGY